HNEVPGITIPEATRAALHAAGDGGAEVGLEMAQTLLEQAEPLVHGTYIMPSFGRYAQAAELVRRIRDRQAARVSRATSAGGASDLGSIPGHSATEPGIDPGLPLHCGHGC